MSERMQQEVEQIRSLRQERDQGLVRRAGDVGWLPRSGDKHQEPTVASMPGTWGWAQEPAALERSPKSVVRVREVVAALAQRGAGARRSARRASSRGDGPGRSDRCATRALERFLREGGEHRRALASRHLPQVLTTR